MTGNKLSIVIPCFNQETNIQPLYNRISHAFERFSVQLEFIFVDSGSTDETYREIQDLNLIHRTVKGLRLSRNFGYQAALAAGLQYALGDHVLLVDSDLRDPPEVAADLYEKSLEGYDVVYGIRRGKRASFLLRFFSSARQYILKKLSKTVIPPNVGEFAVFNERVARELRGMSEQFRLLRGLLNVDEIDEVARIAPALPLDPVELEVGGILRRVVRVLDVGLALGVGDRQQVVIQLLVGESGRVGVYRCFAAGEVVAVGCAGDYRGRDGL